MSASGPGSLKMSPKTKHLTILSASLSPLDEPQPIFPVVDMGVCSEKLLFSDLTF